VNSQNKKALDVQGNKDAEGQKIIVHNKHNGANQRWKIIYTDKSDKPPTSGFIKEWGLYGNRPFFIRSRMPMKRVIEAHGANRLLINRYKAKTTQKFYFNPVSKMIYSNHWKNYCMEITGKGESTKFLLTSTCNSKWW